MGLAHVRQLVLWIGMTICVNVLASHRSGGDEFMAVIGPVKYFSKMLFLRKENIFKCLIAL